MISDGRVADPMDSGNGAVINATPAAGAVGTVAVSIEAISVKLPGGDTPVNCADKIGWPVTKLLNGNVYMLVVALRGINLTLL